MKLDAEPARRAAVLTLGCKVNQFETSAMAESLAAAGYELAAGPAGADVVVVNTCTVTQKADQEALSLIRRVKRLAPAARIVVTGCLAQANPEALVKTGLADLILGQEEKSRLADLLKDWDGSPAVLAERPAGPAADFGAPLSGRSRAFYKIQDGCSAGCAYCAVPLSRGPARSLGLDAVLEGLRSYLARGRAETVLCGIHLGRWGRDLTPSLTLAGLLHAIEGELSPDPLAFRLRLSSLEPLEADDEILEAFELYEWLAPHFHLPLQSGSDRILALMGRPYRAADFLDRAEKLRRPRPLAALGVDVMVGFPGETEADFQATRELLSGLAPAYAHIFPYSPRPGTRAAGFPDQLPEDVKRRRAAELKELDRRLRRDFAARNMGGRQLALTENRPAADGRLRVLTGNYLNALLPPGLKVPAGVLLPVTLAPAELPGERPTALPA